VPAIGSQAHVVHGVKDAPLDGFQAVARIGQRPGVDDRVGVLQERPLHLLLDVDVDDAFDEVLGRRRWSGCSAGHDRIVPCLEVCSHTSTDVA
jgi:hypothetical protein